MADDQGQTASQDPTPAAPAAPLSIMDRMMGALPGESEQDAPPAEEPTEPTEPSEPAPAEEEPEFDITWNGKPQKMRLSDLREYAQKGYDYTQKTQDVASLRSQVESRQAALQEREKMMGALQDQIVARHLAQKQLEALQGVDLAEMAKTDPLSALSKQIELQRATQEYHAADAALRQKAGEYQQQAQQAMSGALQEEQQRLLQRVPEWRDESKRQQETTALAGYLSKEGYTQEEINRITDHRILVSLRKAWLYDQLKAKAPQVSKKVAEVPKEVAAAASQTTAQAEDKALRERIRKSGDSKDAVAWLARRIK